MRPEIKAAWLTALRSGEYEQGIGRLGMRDRDGQEKFCCLGVLCEVAIRSDQESPIRRVKEMMFGQEGKNTYFYDGDTSHLPPRVTAWAWGNGKFRSALSYGDPVIEYEGQLVSLSELNDQRHLSFNEIADVIEEQL
jgi:hypothetical protein